MTWIRVPVSCGRWPTQLCISSKAWLQTMAENIPLLQRAWSVHGRRMYLNEIMLAKGIYVTVIRLCCCVRY